MSDTQATESPNPALDAQPVQADESTSAAHSQATPVSTDEGVVTTATSMTAEDMLRVIKELRQENAKHRKATKAESEARQAAEESALKEQGKYETLYKRATEELATIKADLAKAQRADMQRRIAEKIGLPIKLAARLSGESESEMESDARDMLTALPIKPVTNDANRGNGTSSGVKSYGGLTKEEFAATYGLDARYIA